MWEYLFIGVITILVGVFLVGPSFIELIWTFQDWRRNRK
jgi:hypothetical protein